jgi:hypothetical protein
MADSTPHTPFDPSTFERLHGERPWQLLDRHPDGRHVAMQVIAVLETTVHRAAVWDVEAGRIVWAPEGVSALAWLAGRGDQIALVHEHYEPAADHPSIIGSPLQGEFSYAFALASWPDHDIQVECPLNFPTGWPVDLALSPRGDLAVVQWQDQGESGLEFVALQQKGPRQITETGLPQLGSLRRFPSGGGFPLNTSLVFRQVFSPDGRYLLVPWQDDPAWWSEAAYGYDPARGRIAPTSPGGEYTIGVISVLDWQERTHHMISLIEHLPVGWHPERREDGGDGLLIELPTFVDAEHFIIALPTGTVRAFSVIPTAS